jgi:hypothetical protein
MSLLMFLTNVQADLTGVAGKEKLETNPRTAIVNGKAIHGST